MEFDAGEPRIDLRRFTVCVDYFWAEQVAPTTPRTVRTTPGHNAGNDFSRRRDRNARAVLSKLPGSSTHRIAGSRRRLRRAVHTAACYDGKVAKEEMLMQRPPSLLVENPANRMRHSPTMRVMFSFICMKAAREVRDRFTISHAAVGAGADGYPRHTLQKAKLVHFCVNGGAIRRPTIILAQAMRLAHWREYRNLQDLARKETETIVGQGVVAFLRAGVCLAADPTMARHENTAVDKWALIISLVVSPSSSRTVRRRPCS